MLIRRDNLAFFLTLNNSCISRSKVNMAKKKPWSSGNSGDTSSSSSSSSSSSGSGSSTYLILYKPSYELWVLIRLSKLLLENTCESEECKIAIFVAGGIIAVLVVGGFIYKLYKFYISCQNKKKGRKTGPKAPILVSECKDKKWLNTSKDSIRIITYILFE